jgi:hypothetical protein
MMKTRGVVIAWVNGLGSRRDLEDGDDIAMIVPTGSVG